MFRRYVICLIVSLVSCCSLFGQEENSRQALDVNQWEELSGDLDFPIQKRVLTEKNDNEVGESIDVSSDFSGLKYIFLAFIVVAIVFIIYLIAKNASPINKNFKADNLYALDRLEEDIHERDLSSLLTKAIDQSLYNLAIRIHFLIVIKKLSEQERILWQADKTNRTYLKEMKSHPDYVIFYKLTRLYEKIWFGNEKLSFDVYTKVAPVYTKFNQALESNEKK